MKLSLLPKMQRTVWKSKSVRKDCIVISDYARNGREAVNMVQTLAGISINENRSYIKEEDIEWMAHSSQLSPTNG